MNMQRREFLLQIGLIFLAAKISVLAPERSLGNNEDAAGEAFKEIGTQYLRVSEDHRGVQALKEALKDLSPEETRNLLRQRSKEDYQQGRTFYFDTWILSETEGRFCALFL